MGPVDTFLIVVVCLGAGGGLGWLAARSRSAADVARLQATLDAAQAGEARLEQAMRALSFEATAQSQEAVARAVAPLHDTLRRYEQRVNEMEHDRVDAYAQLREQVRASAEISAGLRAETGQLVAALRTSHVRGRWGEHQLRRIVEAAGMLRHCDFDEQVTAVRDVSADLTVVRPDLVVRLHGGRSVVVDAKVPLDAYLTALEARDERQRDTQLDAHARALRMHVDVLSGRAYWEAFEATPEFVVLFVPADPFLDAALQRDPSLLEHSFSRNVVLATPSTLVALLRTVAYTWRQEALSRNAVQVHELAKQLYARLGTVSGHLTKLGTSLTGSITAYNAAIGSLEQRVLVTARRLNELGVGGDELPEQRPIELTPRQPQAPELL
ncbi:DNA recombination protein RmuC [Catellatospora sp. KI3]|uniref:DNA recombination protein RmuC n=1 Tax=Catellatospora sp. KI3 TaxID=3041620 RepID=UPI0024830D1C|nr:DNA recombination protein RmuC [Catellatospora sp. KI3]MDI1459893.1 DNA recombination protein RmuC [Catellatospora sp. KI3]